MLKLPFNVFETCYAVKTPILLEASIAEITPEGADLLALPHLASHPSSPMPIDPQRSVNDDNKMSDRNRCQSLEAVVSVAQAARDSTETAIPRSETQLCTSSIPHQLLFSIANNFAGFSTTNGQQVLKLLHRSADYHLPRILQCAPESLTVQAIALLTFRAAIETGNANLIKYILNHKKLKVDINAVITIPEEGTFSPLERATILQHRDVVQTLLSNSAAIHNVTADDRIRGPLNLLAERSCRRTNNSPRPLWDYGMVAMLVDAGAMFCDSALERLSCSEHRSLLVPVILRHADRFYTGWASNGTLCRLMWYAESRDRILLIEHLCQLGMDLNCCGWRHSRTGACFNLADIAARASDPDFLYLVLLKNVPVTGKTLLLAIASGSEQTVRLLLGIQGDFCETPGFVLKSLSQATSLGEAGKDILKLMVEHYELMNLLSCRISTPAWKIASDTGSAWMVQVLLQHGIQIPDSNISRALVLAIRQGRDGVAKLLIDCGSGDYCRNWLSFEQDVEYQFKSFMAFCGEPWYSPIMEALRMHNLVLLRQLLYATSGMHCVDAGGCICDLAVEWGNYEAIQLLLDAGLDLNYCMNRDCKSCLVIAVEKSDIQLVKFLVAAGLNISQAVDCSLLQKPRTALCIAAKNGNIEMTRFLLDNGADPHDDDALAEAIGHTPDLRETMIQSHRARYRFGRPGFGARALTELIRGENFGLFKWLIDGRIDVKEALKPSRSRVKSPWTAAIRKACEGNTKFLEAFLQLGCSPEMRIANHPDNMFSNNTLLASTTAFLAAIITGNVQVVRLFLRYNADVNAPTRIELNRTPLQCAAEGGYGDIVQLLINSGADVNTPAAERAGGTALQLAAIGGYNNIVILLLGHGANVNAPTSKFHGRSALEGAAEHGRLDTVKLVLNAGAARAGKDPAEIRRAMDYADKNGFSYIKDMLQDYLTQRAEGNSSPFVVGDPLDEFIDWNCWNEMAADASTSVSSEPEWQHRASSNLDAIEKHDFT